MDKKINLIKVPLPIRSLCSKKANSDKITTYDMNEDNLNYHNESINDSNKGQNASLGGDFVGIDLDIDKDKNMSINASIKNEGE